MRSTLFVERFLTEQEAAPTEVSTYDDRRGYAVTGTGEPVVALGCAGRTRTVTEVRNEAPDSDPEPDTQTWTFVEAEGRDVSFLFAPTETFTRVKNEVPDMPSMLGQETLTKVRAEGRDQASLFLETLESHRSRLAIMTKTGVERRRDNELAA